MKGVESLDFLDKHCNCKTTNEGCCNSGLVSDCRKTCIVHEATCLCCNKIYIGNTQQELKNRMSQHFGDVVKLVNKEEKSDSFAAHPANHFQV